MACHRAHHQSPELLDHRTSRHSCACRFTSSIDVITATRLQFQFKKYRSSDAIIKDLHNVVNVRQTRYLPAIGSTVHDRILSYSVVDWNVVAPIIECRGLVFDIDSHAWSSLIRYRLIINITVPRISVNQPVRRLISRWFRRRRSQLDNEFNMLEFVSTARNLIAFDLLIKKLRFQRVRRQHESVN